MAYHISSVTAHAARHARGTEPRRAQARADFPQTSSTPPVTAPTAQSVFGANPWLAAPAGQNPDGSTYSFNPMYFASVDTAEQVAALLGGKVVASNEITGDSGSFVQQQPNQMVQLSNGRTINAGLVASFFTHGYPQSYIDRLIAREVAGGTEGA